jgi:hypothetical protein
MILLLIIFARAYFKAAKLMQKEEGIRLAVLFIFPAKFARDEWCHF